MIVRLIAAMALSLVLSACATKPDTPSSSNVVAAQGDAEANRWVEEAARLVVAHKPAQALPLAEKAIASYENAYRKEAGLVYSSRSPDESLLYALQGASAKTSTNVYGIHWGLAYFLKGYALVDLQRIAEARLAFDAAIALSPRNSKYLSERGEVEISQKNWAQALIIFQRALDAAEFSPPKLKTSETTRALRGMAYAQIELGNLDAAKSLHQRVLLLDPQNKISLNELEYIDKQQRRPNPLRAR